MNRAAVALALATAAWTGAAVVLVWAIATGHVWLPA